MTSTSRFLHCGALAALLWLTWTPAQAQNSSMQELLNRVDRLQRELSTLQRQVYRGEAPPAAAPLPGSGSIGSSAPAESDAGDPRVAARNSVRITQLENEIRNLTGRVEEVDFGLRQIRDRLDRLVTDVDQRLAALEGGQPTGPLPPAGSGIRSPGDPMSAVPQSAAPPANGAPVLTPPPLRQPQAATVGAPPRPLGTIPRDAAVTEPRGPDTVPPQPPAAGGLPAGTEQEQYDYALSLMLQKQDFAMAETALRSFVEAHPEGELAGNAQYWLGETHYVRKNYQDAAFAFAESYQKYPKGSKAADSLLKLGMSLAQLDKKREACTAYSRLLSNFPDANARLKARVQRERSAANCQ